MRTLVLMRGAPGSGKSNFISNNGLSDFAISPDTLRLLFQSPEMNTNSTIQITNKNDEKVWDLLIGLLENRMKNGDFTIIDATHTTAKDINRYRSLASKYRYRTICVDFSHVDKDTLLKQNQMREPLKVVPVEVIEKFYRKLETSIIPNWVTTVTPEKFGDVFQYKARDLSSYKKIHHFGDIHGCFDVISEYLKDGLNDDEFYIFVGDYIDRGVQNAETLTFLFTLMNRKNVVFLEGNHEIHLWNWANDNKSYSREFESYTKKSLNDGKISKKTARSFYRGLNQCVYYTYFEKQVLVTHGGLSYLPTNLSLISTNQLIKGVGDYSTQIDQLFHQSTDINTYQIHGHRNIQNFPSRVTERTFNLEGRVELGGHMRVATLDREGFSTHEIKNNTFSKRFSINKNDVTFDNQAFLSMLKSNRYIRQKKQLMDNISSFNFDKKVFYDKLWDEQTIKARGLFINTETTEIVARSYQKFFNLGEVESTTLESLKTNLVFPVRSYKKENGFLGIMGYDTQSDSLVVASKSTTDGPYKGFFEEILYDVLPLENIQKMKSYMRDNNTSCVFEVIDPINDPHLIKYSKPTIVLLDIVYRTPDFSKLDYENMVEIAKDFGVSVKEEEQTFLDWEEFTLWYHQVKDDYSILLEGYVIEDANGFMTKIKLPYYSFWKHMRTIKERITNGKDLKKDSLSEPLANSFVTWLTKTWNLNQLENLDIINLRDQYERDHI